MSEEYLEMIEQEFERQFGLHSVRAEYALYIPHQVNLKVKLPVEPTPGDESAWPRDRSRARGA